MSINKQKILKLCKDIEKKNGEGSIFSLGSKHSALKIPRFSTGIEDLDYALGGGMPKGRIIEIFGVEGSGKTSLGYHLMSRCEMGLYIPIEGTFDASRAKVFGNKPKQMLIYRATFGEDALNKTIDFASAGVPIIIIDSVPACIPKDDKDKALKNLEDQNRIGGVARLFSRALPELSEICETTGTTLILINQVRDKIDAMMFGEKTDTPGGKAIKFYSSVRIQLARRAWIEIPNKDPRNTAKNQKVGLINKMKVVKSKICNPLAEIEVPMFFDRGYVSYDDIQPIRKELMEKNNNMFNKGKPKEEGINE
jgi:recombination protein RecA